MGNESGNGRGPSPWIAIAISIALAVGQIALLGTWLGGMAKQIEINTRWIEERNALNIDSRLAVVEQRVNQIDGHLAATDDRINSLYRQDIRH